MRINYISSRLLLWAVALVASPLHAETISGRIVGVTDGDTVTVLDANRTQYKIRLAGIDAPEKAQPFGQRSKEYLSDLVFDRAVIVEWEKRDRYGRIVGKILVNGRDANLEQMKAGMAWWYEKYRKEQSVDDQRRYAEAEGTAKAKRVGLWRDLDPIPPWDWRKRK